MTRLPRPSRILRTVKPLRPQAPIIPAIHRSQYSSSSFQSRPGPPKLPADQQAEFERLQREASVSSAFQPVVGADNEAALKAQLQQQIDELDDEDAGASRGLFRGAKPEFEGDTNPKTGEVGGPKNEPLRWGADADWSYNGRVTDF
ncbi:Protein of unknown function (DUF1674) [Geosmithia morbida]|uniref:Succinate dehydrogenase assembly factor 4, mitochondrial n=1 Tax=Geosmithia morbida TaxID=1094350 RepID=A0A9P4YSJ9_9HYPO|nr:Protein of unknown function (DUF1674) [Geosmithia morbida]KAF4121995.1 Protein of unknown function (DUF1674) [Geosmithia morbida]